MKKMDYHFIVKIATFNTLGFCVTVAGTIYVDAKLTSHVSYGARNYPLGYWPCALGPIIFLWTLVRQRWVTSWKENAIAPAAILGLAGIISMPFYYPEIPHYGVLAWLMQYFLICLISSWIHFVPLAPWLSQRPGLDRQVKIERIKEEVYLWRTVAFSIAFGFLALLIPGAAAVMNGVSHTVSKPDEAFLVIRLGAVQLSLVTLYVLLCLVPEVFRKAYGAADLLLET